MPKVKLFTVKANVTNGVVTIDHESKTENPEAEPFNFDSKDITKYSQEVAEFNNIENTAILQMGDGDYTIEFKLIV